MAAPSLPALMTLLTQQQQMLLHQQEQLKAQQLQFDLLLLNAKQERQPRGDSASEPTFHSTEVRSTQTNGEHKPGFSTAFLTVAPGLGAAGQVGPREQHTVATQALWRSALPDPTRQELLEIVLRGKDLHGVSPHPLVSTGEGGMSFAWKNDHCKTVDTALVAEQQQQRELARPITAWSRTSERSATLGLLNDSVSLETIVEPAAKVLGIHPVEALRLVEAAVKLTEPSDRGKRTRLLHDLPALIALADVCVIEDHSLVIHKHTLEAARFQVANDLQTVQFAGAALFLDSMAQTTVARLNLVEGGEKLATYGVAAPPAVTPQQAGLTEGGVNHATTTLVVARKNRQPLVRMHDAHVLSEHSRDVKYLVKYGGLAKTTSPLSIAKPSSVSSSGRTPANNKPWQKHQPQRGRSSTRSHSRSVSPHGRGTGSKPPASAAAQSGFASHNKNSVRERSHRSPARSPSRGSTANSSRSATSNHGSSGARVPN